MHETVHCITGNIRGGDDDFGVGNVLVEDGVGALLVGSGDKLVTLVLKPLADTELVLSATEKTGLVLGVLASL